jgi:geranylgeranyl reductase family protein
MENYDVIVAGAGMAGSLAAAMAAKKGMKTLLVDRNKSSEAGKKTNWGWVCGEAVAAEHIKFIKSKIDIDFAYPEIELKVDGVFALSPDLQHRFKFEGEGFVLDRPEFERKLLACALKNGVEFVQEFEVEGPIIENGYVVGITGRGKDKQLQSIKAKVTIDALGVATPLRRKLPENPYLDRTIDISDVEVTGRYIYEFELDHEDSNYFDVKNAIIHLDQTIAPGGYGWVFPKEKNMVNIGIGVQKESLDIRNKKLGKKDTLQTLMDEYVKRNPVLKNLKLYNKDNNGKGYWSVPVRRPMESLVLNGYMGAGDCMAMPNPLSAGGIGSAMIAGLLAAENAARAIGEKDVSMKGLWNYNLDFNKAYGKKTAGLEVLRVYLQSINNETINYGMRNFMSSKEAEDLSYGRVTELSIASKFKMVLKGASNIGAFTNLLFAINKMKELNALYAKYPESPDGFAQWRQVVTKHIEEAKERFKPNPI